MRQGSRQFPRWLVWGLVLLAASGRAMAADWHQVEVLAFRYSVEENSAWSPARALPDFSAAYRLAPPPEAPQAIPGPVAWEALPAHELRLAGARQALARTGRVIPLFHIGWRQRTGEGRLVYLASPPAAAGAESGEATRPFLEGAVRISPVGPGFRLDSSFVAHTVEASILLGESRTMAEGDLHYLDHPLVGVIVQVTPYLPPGATAPTPADGAPLNPLPLKPATQPAVAAPPR